MHGRPAAKLKSNAIREHLYFQGLSLPQLSDDAIDRGSAHDPVIDTGTASAEISLPAELRAFWRIVLALTLVCAVCECFCYFVLHRGVPYIWPPTMTHDSVDLRDFIPRFHSFHRLEFFSLDPSLKPPFGYPAPAAVLYECFFLTSHPILLFYGVGLGLLSVLGGGLFRCMRAEGLGLRTTTLFMASAVVLSYPLWFEFLLGNLEALIFLMVAAGVLAFLRGHSYTAAALIAIAGSMKVVPLIYLGLLVARKQYRQLLFAIALLVTVTLASLWLVYPNIAVSWRHINEGLNLFRDSYMLHFRSVEMGFDHSLFGAIKQFTLSRAAPATISRILSWYTVMAASAGTLLFFARIRRLAVLNQVLCLTVAAVLLPPLSHDYTLLNLYLSWSLLIVLCLRLARERRRLPGMMAVFVCFAILMSPQTELIHAGQSYGGQIKCFVLIALMALALRFPFVSDFDQGYAVTARESASAAR